LEAYYYSVVLDAFGRSQKLLFLPMHSNLVSRVTSVHERKITLPPITQKTPPRHNITNRNTTTLFLSKPTIIQPYNKQPTTSRTHKSNTTTFSIKTIKSKRQKTSIMTKTGSCYDDYQLVSPNGETTNTTSEQQPQLRLIDTREQDETTTNDSTTTPSVGTPRQVKGAAAAGGLFGLLVGGPLVGVVAAGGAAVLAATTNGKAGEVARASGEAMASAGDRLMAWNQQHHVTDKTAQALSKTGQSFKEMDDKHKVTEKVSTGIVQTCQWVSQKLQPPVSKQATQTADEHTTRLTAE
jgi:hypothetical protein